MKARTDTALRDPESMSTALARETPDAELFVREHAPAAVRDRQRAVGERLARLERSRVLGDVAVRPWSPSLPAGGGVSGEGSRDRPAVERLRRWAAGAGCDLEPGFLRRRTGSLVDDGSGEVLQLPFVCVALSVDGELRAVFPHSEGGDVRTVADCLDALERGGWRFAWFTAFEHRPARGPRRTGGEQPK